MAKVKATWKNGATTEARLKTAEYKVRGGRNLQTLRYVQTLPMVTEPLDMAQTFGQTSADKTKRKPIPASRLATKGKTKKKGAAKRQLTSEQVKKAFPSIPWEVNSHVMVKGNASPFDGNKPYWVERNSKLYNGPTVEAIKRQKGKCQHCNRLFMEVDGVVELHHIDGDHSNWKKKNLVALHRDCHHPLAVHRKRIVKGLVKRASHWHRNT